MKRKSIFHSRAQLYLMQRYCQRVERKFTFNFPSAAISYAMILPASGKKVYFLFPERSYILCKDTAKNLISLNIKPL